MVEYSRLFGGPAGSVPAYTQPQFAEVLKKIFTDGVFTGILNTLAVVETDPVALAVRVNSGEAWIQGFWYQNTAYLTKSLAAADPTNPRIDRVVLRLDTVTNFKISIEVLTGTPAVSPTAPALTQTASTYEISLAQVSVLANATSVNNAKITDERTYATSPAGDILTVNTIASSATPTPIVASKRNLFTITALAAVAAFAAPSGTPLEGYTLAIRIKDNGTARALSWNAIYRAGDIALPTTTVLGKTMYLCFIYNSTDTKWDFVGYTDNI
ncbi:MAG: hypothetical protein M1365_17105 [Actinobacteria bacterium]|nr:hypothetical protein [Actinomycetota bacterium]